MRAEARRAGEVVRRLRDFFRTGAAKLEAICRWPRLVAAVAAHHHSGPGRRGRFCVAEMPELMLLADRLQLEVVLQPAVQRLPDAVAAAGRCRTAGLDPRRAPAGSWSRSAWEDSGPGLGPQDLERAFESFLLQIERAPASPVISRAIAETRGRLWGEAADHGVFKLVLPIQETHAHDRQPDGLHIVDDDPSVRDALGLLLGVHDHRLAVFADADSSLGPRPTGGGACCSTSGCRAWTAQPLQRKLPQGSVTSAGGHHDRARRRGSGARGVSGDGRISSKSRWTRRACWPPSTEASSGSARAADAAAS